MQIFCFVKKKILGDLSPHSAGSMGDTLPAGMEIASLNRNPFAVYIHFTPAFINISKLIDVRVKGDGVKSFFDIFLGMAGYAVMLSMTRVLV